MLILGSTTVPSFDNQGTVILQGAHLNPPAGGTVTNDGYMSNFSGESFINGSFTNNPDGLLDVDGAIQDVASSGTFDNRGEMYLLEQDLLGTAPNVAFTNEGDLKFGILGGSWGGFGLHADIQANGVNGSPPVEIHLGGTVEPVFPVTDLPQQ